VESLYKEVTDVEFIVFTHKPTNCLQDIDRVKIVQDKTMFSFPDFAFSIMWMFLFMATAILSQKTY
jgi:tryptophan-rich sensory protein